MVDKNTIKDWFRTGLKPTQAQFWATWDSFWHKDEKIPLTAIDDIENILNAKADAEALTNHLDDEQAHAALFGIINAEFANIDNEIGAINGILIDKADLVNGLVPSNQLPSYVDDVIEVANFASLPVTGESGKIYVTTDDNKIYRWSGSVYAQIGGGTTPTLQEVTTAGAVSTNGIKVTESESIPGIVNYAAIEGVTISGIGVTGNSEGEGVGLAGSSISGIGGYLSSNEGTAMSTYSGLGRSATFDISSSNTSNIVEFQKNGTTLSAIQNDGKIKATAGTALTDVVVKSQLDALNKPQIQDFNTYTSLPVATEQILSTFEIPANFLEDGDLVEFVGLLYSLNGTARIYINSINSLNGVLCFYDYSNTTQHPYTLSNKFLLKNGVLKNIPNELVQTSGPTYSNEIAFNPANVNYLIVAVLISASDSLEQQYSILKKIN